MELLTVPRYYKNRANKKMNCSAALNKHLNLRGSIIHITGLWIPAYARMTNKMTSYETSKFKYRQNRLKKCYNCLKEI